MKRSQEIKQKIATLQAELNGLEPHESLGVRELARIAGISPSTASRFKAGKTIDAKTIYALHAAGMITKCPHCGAELKGGAA